MCNEISIRKMTFEDIADVAIIEKKCFSMPWSEKSFEDSLKQSYSHFFVAEYDNIIAGYMGVYCVVDEADITNVAVLPEYRRKGIAKKLILHIENMAKDIHVKQINLEVRESNRQAINLYEQMGFKNIGIRKSFYEKPVENAAIMTYEVLQ